LSGAWTLGVWSVAGADVVTGFVCDGRDSAVFSVGAELPAPAAPPSFAVLDRSRPALIAALPSSDIGLRPTFPDGPATLGKVMQHLLKDDTEVYKQFVENESFRRFVGDMVYQLTSHGQLAV
jgi:hypothetical protein